MTENPQEGPKGPTSHLPTPNPLWADLWANLRPYLPPSLPFSPSHPPTFSIDAEGLPTFSAYNEEFYLHLTVDGGPSGPSGLMEVSWYLVVNGKEEWRDGVHIPPGPEGAERGRPFKPQSSLSTPGKDHTLQPPHPPRGRQRDPLSPAAAAAREGAGESASAALPLEAGG